MNYNDFKTANIDLSKGNYFKYIVDSNIKFELLNIQGSEFFIEIIDGNKFMVLWFENIVWIPNNIPINITEHMILCFESYDNGVTWVYNYFRSAIL